MPPLPAFLRRALPVVLLLLSATLALWLGLRLQKTRAIAVPPAAASDSLLSVTLCAIGNGEAAFIRTPHGKIIVIGTGPPGTEANLVASLKQARAQSIALLVLPYPYAEAIGGTSGLLRVFSVERVVEATPASAPSANKWHALARSLCKEKNIPLQTAWAGQDFVIDGVHINILAPAQIPLAVDNAGANNSLVCRVRWGKTAFLFAGGLEQAGENALLSRNPPLAADFLRVARMGTARATTPEFLKLVGPHFVVVSAAGGIPPADARPPARRGDAPLALSDYPGGETLRRVTATGAPIWLTGTADENLVFMSDGARVWASPNNPPAVLIQ